MTEDISPGLARRIRDAAERAEAQRDKPLTEDTEPTPPGHARSVVLSVHLYPDELDALNAGATRLGVPAASLAQGLILDGIG